MLSNYLLNQRGQIRLLVFAAALAICHFIAVVYNADFIDIDSERLLIITIAFSLVNGAHVLFLAIFNYFFRHPLTRYLLLGLTFELLLVFVFLFGYFVGGVSELSFKGLFKFYTLVHTQGETWYLLILPSMVTSAAAIIIELKEGRYYAVEKPKHKDISLLDDL